jgi:purine-binding chemotaxis protein CheW
MDERARRLATVRGQQVAPADVIETLGFRLGQERYAVESKYVREVVRLVDFTPVPGGPDFLIGVVNLRGHILAVANLHEFLCAPHQGLTDLGYAIVLGNDRPELGILADEAHELRAIPLATIGDPPPSIAGIGREHLLGVTSDALVVLDGARLLADPRLFADPSEL